jgi:hypothetical protein
MSSRDCFASRRTDRVYRCGRRSAKAEAASTTFRWLYRTTGRVVAGKFAQPLLGIAIAGAKVALERAQRLSVVCHKPTVTFLDLLTGEGHLFRSGAVIPSLR